MAQDYGAPEARSLPRSGPEVVERQKVTKERAVQNPTLESAE